MALTRLPKSGIADGSVDSAKIENNTITNTDISPSAAISTTKLSSPGSGSVYLKGDGTYGAICTAVLSSDIQKNAFNISLLGFKMAVNDGLTVFNLVDGVVDEFNDESGTDESEGSNDIYVAACDYYHNVNITPSPLSAGFSVDSVTSPTTSTAGTNPAQNLGTFGSFTVPCGMTSANVFTWGAGGGGGSRDTNYSGAGSGGFASGTLAVTAGQSFKVVVGEGGHGQNFPCSPITPQAPTLSLPLGSGGIGGPSPSNFSSGSSGGGMSGLFHPDVPIATSRPQGSPGTPYAPQVFIVGGGGGGSGFNGGGEGAAVSGSGGGLQGLSWGGAAQTSSVDRSGGGGDQEQGGQGGASATSGGFLFAGGATNDANTGAGGAGYYGGGGGCYSGGPLHCEADDRGGGGGSSYYGHPQITCGATTAGQGGNACGSGGAANPNFPSLTPYAETSPYPGAKVGGGMPLSLACNPLGYGVYGVGALGGNGYVLITGTYCAPAPGGSTTLVSTAFTSTSVPTTARIVVFEENVDTPTLNTDIIASISRDGGTTYTNATLSDSGYVTGSSGQRILTGQATISGQPSGQSMRWKLALANNTVRIHGVSLQWS